jgi:uncharacterized protein YndB with AHSA1/START domain
MAENLVAEVSTSVRAPINEVWDALVSPEKIRRYMFGAAVASTFKVGSPITWKGEWKGQRYEDKGTILRVEPGHLLSYSHFSPLGGKADVPENYHRVTIELSEQAGGTHVALTQDNNSDENARRHSAENWGAMLAGLKNELE